jgi:myo-inositol-1(or 4)-monophosphatase
MLQPDWVNILRKCQRQIQKQTKLFLKTANQHIPSLGIGAGGDETEQIDLEAEQVIIKTLKEHGVSFTLVSEESGVSEYGRTPHRVFVTADPIDGTTNLMRGIPFYAASIAVSTKPILGTVHTALVADLFRGVTYVAQKGKGAFCNDKKILSSKNASLAQAVIGIDLNTFRVQEIVPQITSLIQKTKHIRHLGANALELCYVADGTTDAFIDIRGKLRATDMAAAWLIIEEAGAKMTTPYGKPLNIKLDPKQTVAFIAAANWRIQKSILNLIRTRKEMK